MIWVFLFWLACAQHKGNQEELIFEQIDRVRHKLASDDPKLSEELQDLLMLLQNIDNAEHLLAAEATMKVVNKMLSSNELSSLRESHAELEHFRVFLAQTTPSLQNNWQVYSCPMVDGFSRWVQREGALENPYMGSAMLSCGTQSNWSLAEEELIWGEEIAFYTCPMHTSIQEQRESACPLCGMDLVPVLQAELEDGGVSLSTAQKKNITLSTTEVKKRQLKATQPLFAEITIPSKQRHLISPRVEGWVESVFVKERGACVQKGDPLFSFYSPQLYAAQREFLITAQASTQKKLQLLGMSSRELKLLKKKGHVLEESIYRAPITGCLWSQPPIVGAVLRAEMMELVSLEQLWVEAEVYESFEAPAKLMVEHRGERLELKEIFTEPFLGRQGRVQLLRAELNATAGIFPGAQIDAYLELELGERLSVSKEAIIHYGKRKMVLLVRDERMVPVEVKIGRDAGAWVEVLSGLKEGEKVVEKGVFFLASESRIRAADTVWSEEHNE